MRRRRKKGTGVIVIAIVVICIYAVVMVKKIEVEDRRDKADKQIELLQSKIAKEEERTKEITTLSAYVQTDGYVEDIARDKLGLVYDDEILFVPEGEN